MTSLRDFLKGEKVVRIEDVLSPEYEIGKVILRNQDVPIIFEHVKGSRFKVVGNLCSTREALYRALQTDKGEYNDRVLHALENPIKPEVLESGTCFEVEARSLAELPVLRHFKGDGGRYITASVVIAKDPKYGRNASVHRLMLLDGGKMAIRLVERHLYKYYKRAERQGKALEVAIAIGVHPAVLYAASFSPSIGYDELSLANSLLNGKLKLARCGSVDLEVPENAEIIIEGRLLPNDRVDEGPFVDITGTYDIVRKQPVIEVTRITHRENPYYHALLPGGKEHKVFMGMPAETKIYEELKKVVEVKNVCLTDGGCNWLHGAISIVKKDEKDGRRAIHTALNAHKSMKHVVVVDDDIDVFNPREIEFAIATRFQALKDAVVFPGAKGSSLDPSADKNAITTKLGLDATKPLGRLKDFEQASME